MSEKVQNNEGGGGFEGAYPNARCNPPLSGTPPQYAPLHCVVCGIPTVMFLSHWIAPGDWKTVNSISVHVTHVEAERVCGDCVQWFRTECEPPVVWVQ